MISAVALEALASIAGEFAAGTLELTARGNIQLRGITDPDAVASGVSAAGLLPSESHELVRNIVASPLSGRRGTGVDVRPFVERLDAAIQAEPDLADLPGRFLFSIDDGTGDVAGLRADAGVISLGDGTAALLLAGRDTGVRLAHGEVVDALIGVARRFTRMRGTAWRIAELDDCDVLVHGRPRTASSLSPQPPGRAQVGWITQDDGRVTLAAAVPLGVLTDRQARFVAAVGAPVVSATASSACQFSSVSHHRPPLLLCEYSSSIIGASSPHSATPRKTRPSSSPAGQPPAWGASPHRATPGRWPSGSAGRGSQG
jgi:precorrin-3B synthase